MLSSDQAPLAGTINAAAPEGNDYNARTHTSLRAEQKDRAEEWSGLRSQEAAKWMLLTRCTPSVWRSHTAKVRSRDTVSRCCPEDENAICVTVRLCASSGCPAGVQAPTFHSHTAANWAACACHSAATLQDKDAPKLSKYYHSPTIESLYAAAYMQGPLVFLGCQQHILC